jgi:hypothetical protein
MSERESPSDCLMRVFADVESMEDVIVIVRNHEGSVQPYTNEMDYEIAAQMLAAAAHSLLNADYEDDEDEDE